MRERDLRVRNMRQAAREARAAEALMENGGNISGLGVQEGSVDREGTSSSEMRVEPESGVSDQGMSNPAGPAEENAKADAED